MYEENHNWKLGQLASFPINNEPSWGKLGAIRNELIKAPEHYNVRIAIINQIKSNIHSNESCSLIISLTRFLFSVESLRNKKCADKRF